MSCGLVLGCLATDFAFPCQAPGADSLGGQLLMANRQLRMEKKIWQSLCSKLQNSHQPTGYGQSNMVLEIQKKVNNLGILAVLWWSGWLQYITVVLKFSCSPKVQRLLRVGLNHFYSLVPIGLQPSGCRSACEVPCKKFCVSCPGVQVRVKVNKFRFRWSKEEQIPVPRAFCSVPWLQLPGI